MFEFLWPAVFKAPVAEPAGPTPRSDDDARRTTSAIRTPATPAGAEPHSTVPGCASDVSAGRRQTSSHYYRDSESWLPSHHSPTTSASRVVSHVFCLPPRRASPTTAVLLQHVEDDPLGMVLSLPLQKVDRTVSTKALDAAFTRLIQQSEAAQSYDDYQRLCRVCDNFEQKPRLRVMFGLLFLSDINLQRHVEALMTRIARGFADDEPTFSSQHATVLCLLRIIGTLLAEASVDFAIALALRRHFVTAFALLVVEGAAYCARHYVPTATEEGDASSTVISSKTWGASSEVAATAQPKTMKEDSQRPPHAADDSPPALGSPGTAVSSEEPFGTYLVPKESSSSSTTGYGFLRRRWSTGQADRAESPLPAIEPRQAMRLSLFEELTHCLGVFVFGTLYIDMAAVPDVGSKLLTVLEYLADAPECEPLLLSATAVWLEAICRCRLMFDVVTQSAPLCRAVIHLLARATRSAGLTPAPTPNPRHAVTAATLSCTDLLLYSGSFGGAPPQPPPPRRTPGAGFTSLFASLLGRAGTHRHVAKRGGGADVAARRERAIAVTLEHLRHQARTILPRLACSCPKHGFHAIASHPRPSHFGIPIEELLGVSILRTRRPAVTGDLGTCTSPAIVALREFANQVQLLARTLLADTNYRFSDERVTPLEVILVLENQGLLTRPSALAGGHSTLVMARFRDFCRCSACGKHLLPNPGRGARPATTVPVSGTMARPIVCAGCNAVRYCSISCEKKSRDLHEPLCVMLQSRSAAPS